MLFGPSRSYGNPDAPFAAPANRDPANHPYPAVRSNSRRRSPSWRMPAGFSSSGTFRPRLCRRAWRSPSLSRPALPSSKKPTVHPGWYVTTISRCATARNASRSVPIPGSPNTPRVSAKSPRPSALAASLSSEWAPRPTSRPPCRPTSSPSMAFSARSSAMPAASSSTSGTASSMKTASSSTPAPTSRVSRFACARRTASE